MKFNISKRDKVLTKISTLLKKLANKYGPSRADCPKCGGPTWPVPGLTPGADTWDTCPDCDLGKKTKPGAPAKLNKKYEHWCTGCQYIESHIENRPEGDRHWDFYSHRSPTSSTFPIVLARYGPEEGDYTSYLETELADGTATPDNMGNFPFNKATKIITRQRERADKIYKKIKVKLEELHQAQISPDRSAEAELRKEIQEMHNEAGKYTA